MPLPALLQGGVQGRVRSWADSQQGQVMLSMQHNRWCGNIGRAHRSNGIYIIGEQQASCIGARGNVAVPGMLTARHVLPATRQGQAAAGS